LHLNLEEAPNKDVFLKLIDATALAGCNYYCFNIKITICNDCKYIDKRTLLKCSKCGSKNIDYGTRVIGYLKRVSCFSSARQEEHELRHYHIEEKETLEIGADAPKDCKSLDLSQELIL
jgi:ribonucleoside-triphosphate reductase